MIQSGQRITPSDLDTLAALANTKIPNALPFQFYRPWHVLGISTATAGVAIGGTIADVVKISGAEIGDLAITRERVFPSSNAYLKVYRLTALPATTLANWTAITFTDLCATPFTGVRNVSGGGTFKALFDLQEWNFAGGDGTRSAIDKSFLERQFFYRWNPTTAAWMPVGSWTAELDRIRHFAFRALTNRNPVLSESDVGGLNMGIKESCRVSGPWPVFPDAADNYLQQSRKDVSGRQMLSPTLYFQSAAAGTDAVAGSKGRIVCYPQPVYEIHNNPLYSWYGGPGGDMMVMRLTMNTNQTGKLRGSITFFDVVRPYANIGIQLTRQFPSADANSPDIDQTEITQLVTQIYFDTDFAGGDLLIAADWQPIPGAPHQPYMPTGIPETFTRQQRPQSGAVTIGGPNDAPAVNHTPHYGSRGATLRFTIDYDVGEATGLSRNRLWSVAFTADVKTNPTDAYSGSPNPVAADENNGEVGYGATLYPVADPNFPAPGVNSPRVGVLTDDGPGDPDLLPYPYVPNTNDNMHNAVFVGMTKPPLPFNFIPSITLFAPNARPYRQGQGGGKINHEIQPYPIARNTDRNPPIITVGGDDRTFAGMIIEITISRMTANGVFPPTSAGISCDIGAFGIMGTAIDVFTTLHTLALATNKNIRTIRWQEPTDAFPGIIVLSPIPLAYRCSEPLLVQCLFIPTVPLSNYSEALPVTYSPATDNVDLENQQLKYTGIPILAHHYNDTETLLNLL